MLGGFPSEGPCTTSTSSPKTERSTPHFFSWSINHFFHDWISTTSPKLSIFNILRWSMYHILKMEYMYPQKSDGVYTTFVQLKYLSDKFTQITFCMLVIHERQVVARRFIDAATDLVSVIVVGWTFHRCIPCSP